MLESEKKPCRVCCAPKGRAEYSKDSCKKDGLRSICKDCDKARVCEWQKANPERVNEKNAVWQKKNRQEGRERHARWRARYPEKDAARKSAWAAASPEKRAIYNAKVRSTPKGKIEDSVRRGIRKCISPNSKNSRRTFDLLGYTSEDLRAHLEGQFRDGMSWENYGIRGWHIDHIRPLASFCYETPDDPEFKKAWALSNLQPLWAVDNWRKHAKWSPDEAAG